MLFGNLRFVLCLLAGAITSQGPEFIQQYTQRVGGGVQELQTVAQNFDRDARAAGLSRAAALDSYRRTQDGFLNTRSQTMETALNRYDHLSRHYRALREAGMMTRLQVFLSGMDDTYARKTAGDYKPAIPVTAEGLLYGFGGFAALYLVLGILRRLMFSRRRA